MGRPTDLTDDMQKRIIEVLTSGATIKDTCAYVGIEESTYYRWINRGKRARKGDELYIEFSKSTHAARVQARIGAVAIIRKAVINGDVDAAKWYLERSDPTQWGRKDMLISLGLDSTQLKVLKQQIEAAGLDLPTIFEEMINELSGTNRIITREE